jgi:hypothetical protein
MIFSCHDARQLVAFKGIQRIGAPAMRCKPAHWVRTRMSEKTQAAE